MKQESIRIVVIRGSVRPGNYTARAAAVVIDELRRQDVFVDEVDPSEIELPPPGVNPKAPQAVHLREMVEQSTGVIFATPEYHGSFSSVTKLIIENLGFPSVLAQKPISLVGVAAGEIGAVKALEALRGVCSHVGGLVLPGPVSVANVQDVFDEDGNCLDLKVEKRLRSVAKCLLAYIRNSICPRLTLEAMSREGI